MAGTYVHLSGKNTDKALLKMNGIEVSEEVNNAKIQPKICQRCDTLNASEHMFCCKCGSILDVKSGVKVEQKLRNAEEQRSKVDSLMNQLVKDPAILQMLAEKIKEIAG